MFEPALPTFTGMLTTLPGLPLALPAFGVALVAGSVTILPMPPLFVVVLVGAGRVKILPGVCDGVPFWWLLAGRLTIWPPLPSLPMTLLSIGFCTTGRLPLSCEPPLPCCISGMYLGWPRLPILKVGLIFCGAKNFVACISGTSFGCA